MLFLRMRMPFDRGEYYSSFLKPGTGFARILSQLKALLNVYTKKANPPKGWGAKPMT